MAVWFQVANRQCVEYDEPHRKAMIDVDFGNSVGVYFPGYPWKKISKAKRLLAILEDGASVDPRARAKKLSRCSSSFARYQL
jgi:hypothetical protein